MTTRKAKSKTTKKEEQDVLQLSEQAYQELTAELEHRKNTVRQEIAQAIKEARNLGDLSENAPYEDAMQRKEMNEARIEKLEYLLSIAQVVELEDGGDIVTIGRKLEIRKVGGTKRIVTLVGKEESQQADPSEGKISIDSPLGAALNNSRIGDTVSVMLPMGEVKYKIVKFV